METVLLDTRVTGGSTGTLDTVLIGLKEHYLGHFFSSFNISTLATVITRVKRNNALYTVITGVKRTVPWALVFLRLKETLPWTLFLLGLKGRIMATVAESLVSEP
jgi:hypothetical protein